MVRTAIKAVVRLSAKLVNHRPLIHRSALEAWNGVKGVSWEVGTSAMDVPLALARSMAMDSNIK